MWSMAHPRHPPHPFYAVGASSSRPRPDHDEKSATYQQGLLRVLPVPPARRDAPRSSSGEPAAEDGAISGDARAAGTGRAHFALIGESTSHGTHDSLRRE